jgi:hypothetical protein
MLFEHVAEGTVLIGLHALVMGRRTPIRACYRVVTIKGMGLKAIEFFGHRANAQGLYDIIALPYRPGQISVTETHGSEVISGEFTGCVMALYLAANGTLRAGHVDTADGTSQRATWAAGKVDGSYRAIAETDTLPMFLGYDAATANSSIMCIANPARSQIYSLYVERAPASLERVTAPGSNFSTPAAYNYTVARKGPA